MLESQPTSTVRSLTEASINIVQDNYGNYGVDLSLLNTVDFEDVRKLEKSIPVLTYMNPREKIATSQEQYFIQQVISICSTGNLLN